VANPTDAERLYCLGSTMSITEGGGPVLEANPIRLGYSRSAYLLLTLLRAKPTRPAFWASCEGSIPFPGTFRIGHLCGGGIRSDALRRVATPVNGLQMGCADESRD
jgi:hypothetical protein